jgi:SAM-dependent methyltransferase
MSGSRQLQVDPSNKASFEAWDGDEGAFWAEHAARFDAAVAGYRDEFLAATAIGPDDRVLDIGCGTGQTTRDAARAASRAFAFGVDLSAKMIERARRLAADEGVTNARFEQADAQVHPFDDAAFDVAISRTGTMFFGDPVAAFSNIARALRRDGRLVMATWQALDDNEWIREIRNALAAGRDMPAPPPDAPGPFSLSEPDRVRDLLGRTGFGGIELRAVRAPMRFGDGVDDACSFILGVAGWMLDGLDDDGRRRALDALRATIAAHETADGVLFGSAMWMVGARRT